ncbi:endonuclease/exonuclease/phosphatase family protein [Prevotella jejuni]
MFSKFKKLTYRVLLIGNIIVVLLMLLVGNIGRLNPVDYPSLANLGLGFPILLVFNLVFLVVWCFCRLRSIWLPLLGFILCYGPIRTYSPFNFPEDKPHGSIKVLSYNVFMFSSWDEPHGAKNPIVDYIVKSKADIVCLQEAQARLDNGDQIYSTLKKHYPYFKLMIKKHPGADYIVLLSKYPVLWQDTIPYGSSSNQSVAYMLDIKGTKTLVVNNHFESNGLSSGDKEGFKTLVKGELKTDEAKKQSIHLIKKLGDVSARRAPQAEAVARFVKKYLDKQIPVILCGDFNDSPLSYTHHVISKELNDCYVESGNGPGISYHKSGMYFRIDHIFCSDDFESYGAKVDNSVTTSDHYPIYCWLKYRPKP